MLFSGVVLAGGASKRMGVDKRFLEILGMPLVMWVLERLRPLVEELILVTMEPHLFHGIDARVVTDQYPGRGVLAGVHGGLIAAKGEWAFVVAGDMPFLNLALLQAMANLALTADADALVPQWEGELEPLHALYRPQMCAPVAESALLADKRRIVSFYPAIRMQVLSQPWISCWDVEGRSFFNVNTSEDWEATLSYVERQASVVHTPG